MSSDSIRESGVDKTVDATVLTKARKKADLVELLSVGLIGFVTWTSDRKEKWAEPVTGVGMVLFLGAMLWCLAIRFRANKHGEEAKTVAESNRGGE